MPPRLTIWTDCPALGGIGEFAHSLALGMQKWGYDVTIVAPEIDAQMAQIRGAAGVHHVEAQLPERQQRGRIVTSPADTAALLRELAPDVILFADTSALSNLLSKQVAYGLKIPMVFSIGTVLEEHALAIRQRVPGFQRLCESAARVVTASRAGAELLTQKFPIGAVRPTFIHYGRPDRFFAPVNAARRERRRAEIGCGAEEVVFVTVARYDVAKGFDLFAPVLVRLKQENGIWPRVRFLWVGSGEIEGQLRDGLARYGLDERVHMTGPCANVAEWLDAADVFVLPSLAEGMPLAIIEAMAKGLPVIATDVGGVAEALGGSGILLQNPKPSPEQSINGLLQSIAWVVANPEQRQSLGQRARGRAEILFREDRMIVDYARLIGAAARNAGDAMKPHDYLSPGLAVVIPDAAFPEMIDGNTGEGDWPYLRREVMHRWCFDRRLPSIGFLSRDEAQILYNAALSFTGKPTLEIGCLVGWSTVHLGLAGVDLDVIDPILAQPGARQSVEASLAAAGVRGRVNLVAGASPGAVTALAEGGRRWSLAFIDGDHEGDAPRLDAATVEPLMTEDALVLFHDLAAPAVAQGLRHFRACSWKVRIYRTMQIMAAAWRGNVTPPAHIPDPTIAWSLPLHLADLVDEGAFPEIHRRCAPFTMTSIPRQFALYQATRYIVENRIEGDIVECGVWRGGSMMIGALALAELGAVDRRLALFDTFSGMSPPSEIDRELTSGHTAQQILSASARTVDNLYWAIAPLDDVKRNMAGTGYPDTLIDYVAGDVCETLKSGYARPIALLRLDTDWYASTRCELETLFERLQPGGVLIIDDYGHWAGACRACDEFFSGRRERLHPINSDYTGRILVKGATELPPGLSRRLRLS